MSRTLPLALLAAALAAAAEPVAAIEPAAATAEGWRLSPHSRIEGNSLVVEIPEGDPDKFEHNELDLDLAPLLASGCGAVARVKVRAEGVTEPDYQYNGVKCMLRYVEEGTGDVQWPGASLPTGTFDWQTAEARVTTLTGRGMPEGGKATLVLGLQGCTGRAEFDLSSLALESEPTGVPEPDASYVVRYPESEDSGAAVRRLRGTMLPGRATTEDDMETLHRWGATLVRFQITRNWSKIDDNQDLEEYGAWVDSRLDNLEDVLRWAAERGMKVCVDLHALPGGKHGKKVPEEMAMFSDGLYADAFVETWRRIATRFCGHPALYGYDLVNEPVQMRPRQFSYWELQRRAAEAVRAIDPVTPIIVEANLAAAPKAFSSLPPLRMDNVIYQVHVYEPGAFTHQGVGGRPREKDGKPLAWPSGTWDRDWLRQTLRPVRDFQLRHGAKIYVGEFSAAAWAPGAENYLRDCINLFEEYGWDWTYHAFRESPVWDVEKVGQSIPQMVPADSDTPRKTVLLQGLAR